MDGHVGDKIFEILMWFQVAYVPADFVGQISENKGIGGSYDVKIKNIHNGRCTV